MLDDTIKCIIFDLDGTLYTTKGLGPKIFIRLLFSSRLLFAMLKVRENIKGTERTNREELLNDFFRTISKKTKKPVIRIKAWYFNQFYPAFISAIKSHFTKRENLDEILTILQARGIKLAVYSDYAKIDERLAALDIDPGKFAMTISSEDMGVLKPSARPIEKILKDLGIKPHETVLVGDRPDTDGQSCKLSDINFFYLCDEPDKPDLACSWNSFCHKVRTTYI